MKDIYYNWFEGGGFIIKLCEESEWIKLYEVPPFGGSEIHVGNFESVEEAKEYSNTLT